MSLAVMRVLLVDVNGLPFGFTAQYVDELIRVPHEEMLTVVERNESTGNWFSGYR